MGNGNVERLRKSSGGRGQCGDGEWRVEPSWMDDGNEDKEVSVTDEARGLVWSCGRQKKQRVMILVAEGTHGEIPVNKFW